MAWRMPHLQPDIPDRNALSVSKIRVRRGVGEGRLPQHAVGRVEMDRGAGGLGHSRVRRRCGRVVRVGAHDVRHRGPNGGEDGVRVVGGVDDDAVVVVADDPDVVVDLPAPRRRARRRRR